MVTKNAGTEAKLGTKGSAKNSNTELSKLNKAILKKIRDHIGIVLVALLLLTLVALLFLLPYLVTLWFKVNPSYQEQWESLKTIGTWLITNIAAFWGGKKFSTRKHNQDK